MSSDSEDDCFGNVLQRFELLKKTLNTNTATKLSGFLSPESTKTLNNSISVEDYIPTNKPKVSTADLSLVESDCEEISLDTIIEQNTKKKTRKSKRSSTALDDSVTRGSKRSRTTRNSTKSSESEIEPEPSQRGRGRRGRGNSNTEVIEQIGITRSIRGRGRTPRRGRGRRSIPDFFESIFDEIENEMGVHSNQSSEQGYPTYSVGNTFDYPDECENQPLFTKKPTDVVLLDETESANNSFENEELSVKVYWRSTEMFKFNIRRYQKLTHLFNFFAERENVSQDKLLFMYNDKILKITDTPDSITYNIGKFIDGGIINQSVASLVKKDVENAQKTGLKIKFQCQNVKKPFETVIQPEDKISMAMLMCAEHFEKPLDKMKFYFDGDQISGKLTPQELELEGGECIDVKIMS